jgi:hypothetical protein
MAPKTKQNLRITGIVSVVGTACGFLGMFGARFVFVTEGERVLAEKISVISETLSRFDERQASMQRSLDLSMALASELGLNSRSNTEDIRALQTKYTSLEKLVDRNTHDISKIQDKIGN